MSTTTTPDTMLQRGCAEVSLDRPRACSSTSSMVLRPVRCVVAGGMRTLTSSPRPVGNSTTLTAHRRVDTGSSQPIGGKDAKHLGDLLAARLMQGVCSWRSTDIRSGEVCRQSLLRPGHGPLFSGQAGRIRRGRRLPRHSAERASEAGEAVRHDHLSALRLVALADKSGARAAPARLIDHGGTVDARRRDRAGPRSTATTSTTPPTSTTGIWST